MIKTILLLLAVLLAGMSGAVAQNATTPAAESAVPKGKLKRAEQLFSQLAFTAAIPLYEELAEQSDDPFVRMRLADAYRLTDNFNAAEQWYATLVSVDTIDPLYKYYYGQALMANEKYAQARGWFEAFSKARPDDPRGANLAEACRSIDALVSQSFPAEIVTLPINTARSELGPAYWGSDKLLFAADRDTILGVRRNNDWYDAPFLDFYSAALDEEGMIARAKARPLRGKVNGPYHEGPGQLSGENILYYSSSQPKATSGVDGNPTLRAGLTKLHIQKAKVDGSGRWMPTDETALPFNNPEYSCAHPALSADGLWMIFSSDKPGGFGGSDLYLSQLKADGSSWSDPINLGGNVNTPGDEMFPFWHENGTLYFASDGLPGLGGLDVFETRQDNASWQIPRNLGKPINSSRDDFGLIFDEKLARGFVVSNRFGGAGRDDLYGVVSTGIELAGTVSNVFTGQKISGALLRLRQSGQERERIISDAAGSYRFAVGTRRQYELVVSAPGHIQKVVPVEIGDLSFPSSVQVDVALEDTLLLKLVVQVVDKDSRAPLTDARVMVYNKCTNVNTEVPADEDGILRIRLEPNCTFYVAGRKLGYLDDNEVVSTMGITESSEMAAVLELIEIKEDLVIELKNIYYDYGRYYIREDAVGDLDNLAGLMEQYPSLKIEISSHTDSRGSDEYNKGLSQKRAETCVDYLVTKGISADRLVARGYGEYVLRNDCANGVECSEELHQVNRRTEFKVLSFDRVLYSDEVENPAVNLYKNAFGDDQKYLARTELPDGGSSDPAIPLIVQKNPDEGDPAPGPSGLLAKQQEASRAAAAGVGEKPSEPDKPAPGKRSEKPKQERNKRTVVLEPDPIPPSNNNRQERADSNNRPASRNEGRAKPAAPAATTPPVVEQPERPVQPAPIPAAEQDPDAPWYKTGVSYSVQLAYGSSNTAAFSAYSDLGTIYVEKKANGVPVIVLGYFNKYSEANSMQQVVRSRGIKDAFVISYVDGKRLE
ncbi:MAG: OmpA family protein [Bacteroidetes bacterium]|nr:OmpA family protein [Bacteroidota bacterium]